MSGTWGNNIKYSIFGESHGPSIGIVINGLPAGIKLDMDELNYEMSRRKPGKDAFSTKRNEADAVNILSGYYNEKTTGSPFCIAIGNTDTKSEHYGKQKTIMRPGHADYTGYVKYSGCNDVRGGGHFSGRLTAPIVLAGAIAKQILAKENITIGAHISQIGSFRDEAFDYVNINKAALEALHKSYFPVINSEAGEHMKQQIIAVSEKGDSIGGSIETAILNVPVGVGSPFFDSIESTLSHILFSIPAVKGVEFGAGFGFSSMQGSNANDALYYNENKVTSYTNNNGGILGGISNGMPIIFKVAIKPTPSISLPQNSIDVSAQTNTTLNIVGRHDPCIVPRALPVVEAAAAMAILDLFYDKDRC